MGLVPIGKQRRFAVARRECREPGWAVDQTSMPGYAKIG